MSVGAVLGLVSALWAGAALAGEAPIALSFTLSKQAPQIRGTIEVPFHNHSDAPLRAVHWLLFPNRFAQADSGINDFNRPFVYPYQDFAAGGMVLTAAHAGAQELSWRAIPAPGLAAGCVVAVQLANDLLPGQDLSLRLEFETTMPERFGSFGVFEDMLTALGGWYPYPATLHRDGSWDWHEAPPLSSFDVSARWDEPRQVVLNGIEIGASPAARGATRTRIDAVHYLTLVAADEFERVEIHTASTQIVRLQRPPRRTDRRAFGPSEAEIERDTWQSIVASRPAALSKAPATLLVVEAPLRLSLSAPGEGMAVISDRSLKVNSLLRPFHEVQMAQAIYAEMLRPQLARRESANDYPWVSAGLSQRLAQDYGRDSRPPTRSVEKWIELFNIFAIVDRFENEPRIPFVGAFFDNSRRADELHDQITTFNRDIPPGRVLMAKLEQRVGAREFGEILSQCTNGAAPFLDCAESTLQQPLGAAMAQWLQPYPRLNYEIAATDLSQRQGDEYRSDVIVRRVSSRPIEEPVDVELRTLGGARLRLHWDGKGDEGHLGVITKRPLYQAIIDPDRRLIEDTRVDNAAPPIPQLVIDSSEVEVSSTEFGFSSLAVGRARSDYRKDIAAAVIYTNRSIGVTVGPRYHWGDAIDSTLYRHNLYGFYSAQALDHDFKDKRTPSVLTTGHSNGFGLRYNYNNIFAYDNPTEKIEFRLFGDWYDRSLGSDYNYAGWGTSIVATHPLLTYRTILAGEITNGFTQPVGSSRVPNQGLYSLGGSRSIRGIGVEDQLGRNIFLLRGELRQSIYPELDLNMLDLLVLRRIQARLFVDSGSVSNAAGAVYNPEHYAVGVGAGFAVVYDFMGFFPSQAYVEIATRVDHGIDGVQFLFGTRQAF